MTPPLPTAPQRIYLAGPMRGKPEFNFLTFHAVAWALRQNGHEVFSPAEKDIERHGADISKGNLHGSIEQAREEHKFSLRQALHEDLTYICLHASMLAVLPDWEMSGGTMSEHRTAAAIKAAGEGMEILYLTQDVVDLMKAGYALEHAA